MNMRVELTAPDRSERSRQALESQAERLVVTGFRCWLAGYEHGNVECWEVAWNEYASALGADGARRAIGDLQFWIRALRETSCREMSWFPYGCRYICRDEELVLSLISSLQQGKRGQACAAIHHLTGATSAGGIKAVLEAGEVFAGSLLDSGCRLAPVSEHAMAETADHGPGARPVH